MDDTTESPQFSDPGKAFNDLRSEVRVLRRAVEDWHEAMKKNPPPDYADHYSKISKSFHFLVGQIEELKKFPAQTAESITNAGRGALDEAKKQLAYASNLVDKDREALRMVLSTVQDQRTLRGWLIRAAAGGVVAGMILFYVLARILPLGANTFIAAAIIGDNRWDAGLALLRQSDPDNWQKLIDDTKLVTANRDRIDGCRVAAAKSKKDESCMISVPAGK